MSGEGTPYRSSEEEGFERATITALEGIRVLDFSRILAGPLCTMILGDLGADVIKIEQPDSGDDTRQWGPPWVVDCDPPQSAYFTSINRNKRSVSLNLKTDEGIEIARALAQQSHIVVENFKRGQMQTFGLGYAALSALRPGLVYCSITGFGQTGPYADRPGYDFVVQAMSGLMSITGPKNGPPYKIGVAISDVIAGLSATTSILAALRVSEQTGVGQHIDIALLDTQIAALVNVASGYLASGETPERFGNEHPNIVPYQTFEGSDHGFVVAVGNDRQFGRLCDLVDLSSLQFDPRFKTNPARVANREQLTTQLQKRFAQKPAAVWIAELLQAGIPCGPINDVASALSDPHVQARGLVHVDEGLTMVGSPLRLSETPVRIRRLPPKLGQHTDEVLRELLTLDEERLRKYRADSVV